MQYLKARDVEHVGVGQDAGEKPHVMPNAAIREIYSFCGSCGSGVTTHNESYPENSGRRQSRRLSVPCREALEQISLEYG
jgi:hypothetical protein